MAQVESWRDLRRVIEVGRPLPPYAGAAGKVLLAYLAGDVLNNLFQRIQPVRLPDYLRWLQKAAEQIGLGLGRSKKSR